MTKDEKIKRLEQYVTENQAKYYRLAYSYVKNKDTALDIIQDAIVKALGSIDSLEETTFMQTWFYRIVINTSIDFLRKHKRMTVMEDERLQVHLPTSENEVVDLDLQYAIQKLPPTDQTLITLRFFEDLKIEEVAHIMDLNVNTAKTKLYRALKKLRIEVGEEFI